MINDAYTVPEHSIRYIDISSAYNQLSRNVPERRFTTFLNAAMPLRHFLPIQLFFFLGRLKNAQFLAKIINRKRCRQV